MGTDAWLDAESECSGVFGFGRDWTRSGGGNVGVARALVGAKIDDLLDRTAFAALNNAHARASGSSARFAPRGVGLDARAIDSACVAAGIRSRVLLVSPSTPDLS